MEDGIEVLARIQDSKWVRGILGAALIGLLGVLFAPGSALVRPNAMPQATAIRERPALLPSGTSSPAATTHPAFDTPHDPSGTQHASLTANSMSGHELPSLPLDDESSGVSGAPASSEDSLFDCIIEPFEVVEVGSALTAVLESVEVERSDFVEAGQVLARLDAEVEEAAVVVARARAELDPEVEASPANLAAHKKLRELELQEAIELLERHTIRSPISGVVVERFKSPGELVNQETIMSIAQIDPLRVELALPAAAFGSIKPGMRAEVHPELPDSGVLIASVTLVDRVIDAASGTFGARLGLRNSDYTLPSGLHCQARLVPND